MATSTNNSLTQFLQQLLRVQSNSMEIVSSLSEITQSTANSVFITLTDQTGATASYELPTIGAMQNNINRIDNNFNLLIGQSGSAVTVRLADGTFRKVIQANLFQEPPAIGSLLVPSTFNQKSNWFFENFLNPLLYVSFDITNYVQYNTSQVAYKRIIINVDSTAASQYFDNNYKGRNDVDYNTLLTDLANNSITYFVDDNIANLPVSIARYSGSFDVISYNDELMTVTQSTGQTVQQKVRKYQLSTLKYTDNLQSYQNTVMLKPGDNLTVGLSTIYQVVSVDPSTNNVVLKMTSGTESIPTGVGVLNIAVSSFSIKEAQINVGFDERQIVFIKGIDRDTNLTTVNFSPGAAFHSNDLSITLPDGTTTTLDVFYKQQVMDFGTSLLTLAKEGSIPSVYGLAPDPPRLTATNFQVVLSNSQKQDTQSINNIKTLISQKNTLSAELTQLQTAISNTRQNLNTTKFNTDTEKQAVQNQLTALINKQTSTTNLYNSTVASLSSIASSPPSELSAPEYRVRGFFPIPDPKSSTQTLDQQVVQFIVAYRYLRNDGTVPGTQEIDFVDNTGQQVKAYFSNWTEVPSKLRSKVYDSSLGIYVWATEDVTSGDSVNINQVDIPISQGEQVEIRIKSVSEAGWPTNPITSDWSSSVVIPFPSSLTTDTEITAGLSSAMLEQARVNFNQDLSTMGLPTHLSTSFVKSDTYYAHTSDAISSGFFNPDGSIITLYQQLVNMSNQIAALQATIQNAQGSLSVYIVDPSGQKYVVSNNTLIDLFAGYYLDTVNALPANQQKGAIITSVYQLVIQNVAASPLQLVSLFPGGLDTGLPNSSTSGTTDYQTSRQYDKVAISLSALDASKTANNLTYQTAPFQSAQVLSQYLYVRATDIGLKNSLIASGGSGTANNSLYPDLQLSNPVSSSFVYDLAGGASSSGNLSGFCVHTSHPDVIAAPSGATYGYFEYPSPGTTASPTSPAVYPLFTHSSFFNLQNSDTNGKTQAIYSAPNLSDPNLKNQYPTKLGFYANDRYLIGNNTCGSYLYLSPATYSDLLVNGTDYRATREVDFGDQFQITIPIIYQFRMTDFYGAGTNGTGIVGGYNPSSTTAVKNLYYTKKMGIDIYVQNQTVFSFDVQVSSKYKVDSPSQTGISPVRNTQLSSIQSQTINQIS